MKTRNQTLRKQALKRDKFTCQKCRLNDETGNKLEVHHITPLVFEGKDNINNLITLCRNCHRFAPNYKEEFESYIKIKENVTMTILPQALEKLRIEKPEIFKTLSKDDINRVIKIFKSLDFD